MRKGILLINLGTPESPSVGDVRKYLAEFLMDERVIDINPIARFFLVRGLIVPFRSRSSSKLYKVIWFKNNGSPLLYYSKLQHQLLKIELGNGYQVELAMRYQYPSIKSALTRLRANLVDNIQVIPLFPQYSSATSGSVIAKVIEEVNKWETIPNISFTNSFFDNPLLIRAFATKGKRYNPGSYDHIVFSFHGLPQRHLLKCDQTNGHCLKSDDCCQQITKENQTCYAAQCYRTATLIAEELNIPKDRYTICFQSRLGKDPWLQPYTSETIKSLAVKGCRRVLVFCPSFVADCLETLYEIAEECKGEFIKAGGEHLQLVEGLNDSPIFISALKEIIVNAFHEASANAVY